MNFLRVQDFTRRDIEEVFKLADSFKRGGFVHKLREGTTLALFFAKTSTRTRLSFEVAMAKLDGTSVYLDARSTQVSIGETLADTARMLSSYADFIAARLYKHSDIDEIARHSSVPVINALTDLEHPCQALSDMYTILKTKGKISGLRIAFVGDIAANTANSLMVAATMLGATVVLIGPKNYSPNKDYVKAAQKYGKVEVSNDLKEGLKNVDVIYTDTFVSMGQEAEAEKRKKMFMPYQVNSKAVGYAKRDASVMHCLPAHRGVEITDEVIDGKQSVVWEQAKNKMWVEGAILLYLYKNRN